MDKHPRNCNICNSVNTVEFTTNDKIYGKKYGSGYCYLCTNCGAYVGTHKPRPKEAMGILADKQMRDMKMKCHDLFDRKWKGTGKGMMKRRIKAYAELATKLGIPVSECHFGYFDMDMLNKAYRILSEDTDKHKKLCLSVIQVNAIAEQLHKKKKDDTSIEYEQVFEAVRAVIGDETNADTQKEAINIMVAHKYLKFNKNGYIQFFVNFKDIITDSDNKIIGVRW